jgi:prephenate dehydrogenase
MTRLAASNPDIWRDLLASSAPVTGTGLGSVSNALQVLADLLARRDLSKIADFMERTRNWRTGPS